MREWKSQRDRILEHLKAGKSITQREASRMFGCARLASRISELRDVPYPIEAKMIVTRNGARVARYSMRIRHERG